MRISFLLLIVIPCATLLSAGSQISFLSKVNRPSDSKWMKDLDYLSRELLQHHPKLACGETRDRFLAAVQWLRLRMASLPRSRAIVEIARAIATIRDGHTQIGLTWTDNIGFHRYPLSLYWFTDGIYVRAASAQYSELAGARVLRIGGLGIDEAIQVIRPIIHGDNEMTVRDVLPSRLIIPEVLEAVSILKHIGPASFSFLLADGSQRTLTVEPANDPDKIQWVSARNTEQPPPLYLSDPDNLYWFRYIQPQKLIYVQMNAVQNKPEESFADFCKRLFRFVDTVSVEKFVFDIRMNNGGDNTLNQSMVHGLIRCDKLNQPGKLFTIIGRLTFSAAMNLAVDLERNTKTTFVGEPTGASPNHYGETERLILPNSGLTVLYSSLYWQSSDPRDVRDSIEPQIRAELTAEQYRNNIDPAIDAILASK